jgi:hypothetical protein
MNTSAAHAQANASAGSPGATPPEHGPSASACGPALEAQARQELMAELDIRYNGRYFRFRGYRYDRLEDAVAYARLERSRALQGWVQTVPSEGGGDTDAPVSPSVCDRVEMEALGVSFESGRYVFQGFHYDHLRDALAYARLQSERTGGRPAHR